MSHRFGSSAVGRQLSLAYETRFADPYENCCARGGADRYPDAGGWLSTLLCATAAPQSQKRAKAQEEVQKKKVRKSEAPPFLYAEETRDAVRVEGNRHDDQGNRINRDGGSARQMAVEASRRESLGPPLLATEVGSARRILVQEHALRGVAAAAGVEPEVEAEATGTLKSEGRREEEHGEDKATGAVVEQGTSTAGPELGETPRPLQTKEAEDEMYAPLVERILKAIELQSVRVAAFDNMNQQLTEGIGLKTTKSDTSETPKDDDIIRDKKELAIYLYSLRANVSRLSEQLQHFREHGMSPGGSRSNKPNSDGELRVQKTWTDSAREKERAAQAKVIKVEIVKAYQTEEEANPVPRVKGPFQPARLPAAPKHRDSADGESSEGDGKRKVKKKKKGVKRPRKGRKMRRRGSSRRSSSVESDDDSLSSSSFAASSVVSSGAYSSSAVGSGSESLGSSSTVSDDDSATTSESVTDSNSNSASERVDSTVDDSSEERTTDDDDDTETETESSSDGGSGTSSSAAEENKKSDSDSSSGAGDLFWRRRQMALKRRQEMDAERRRNEEEAKRKMSSDSTTTTTDSSHISSSSLSTSSSSD